MLNVTIETPLQAKISGLEQKTKKAFPCCTNEEVIILHGRILSTGVDEAPYVEDGRNWESVAELMSHMDSNSLCSRLLTIKDCATYTVIDTMITVSKSKHDANRVLQWTPPRCPLVHAALIVEASLLPFVYTNSAWNLMYFHMDATT